MHKISDKMNSKENKDHGLVILQTACVCVYVHMRAHAHTQTICNLSTGGPWIFTECII